MSLPEHMRLFDAAPMQWNDWHWQLAHCVKSLKELEAVSGGRLVPTPSMLEAERLYPMQTTPYYLSLAKEWNPEDPVLRQLLPTGMELEEHPECTEDGLAEEAFSPVPRLVHRYGDRVLFLTCSACAMRCRHCLRKRLWNSPVSAPTPEELRRCTRYLREHPEVREVLVSGGDPFMLPDDALEQILKAFAELPGIRTLRIGTRTPVCLPQRITPELCAMLEGLGCTVWVATHFNHPQELTPDAAAAADRLLRHGIPVVNQSVLLKGVNDDADTLAELFTRLVEMKVKPYYLFHGDPIRGAGCFRTGIRRGLELMAALRGRVSGLALPAYAFDLPEGGGKVRLEPDFQTATLEDGTPVFLKLDGTPVAYR